MILVVGATGQLGGRIALKLRQQNKDVRVLLRHDSPSERLAQMGLATPARMLLEAGCTPAYGDLKDPATLFSACKGIHTVITTANSALRGGADNVQRVDLDGTRRLVDAAQYAGARHFVFTSVFGADTRSPVPFIQAKARSEEHLRASGMAYTILQPNAFMEVWVGMVVAGPVMSAQPVTLLGEGRRKHSFVSMNDVAEYAVAAVDNAKAFNRKIVIGGPEAVSWRDVINAFEQALGRKIEVRMVPPGDPVPGVADAVLPLMAGFETYDSPIEMGETSATFGVSPTPLSQVVAAMVERSRRAA